AAALLGIGTPQALLQFHSSGSCSFTLQADWLRNPEKQPTADFAEDPSKGTDIDDASSNFDQALLEDPDAVREAFEGECLWQKENEEMWNTRNHPTKRHYTSSSSSDCDEYLCYDSDREPKHGD
ncbi:unnamed protein product, partial [Urochloa humidicola]